jgi:TonB-linked outer membrane protein, SusC/RagA family
MAKKSNNFLLLRKQMLAITMLLASAGALYANPAMDKPDEAGESSAMIIQQAKVSVKGVVSDAFGTVPGANVVEKGTTNGAVTDMNGEFSLNVASNATLIITYVGYQTQEVSVNGRTSIEILIQEDLQALSEVIVVGYGVQKKINLTGSVSTISSEKIASRPSMNLSSTLAGLAPGVRVTQGRGNPGDENVSINIRGLASINASSPMILVDGAVADMSVLNPDDVESISILKDAASAAIYGSRAASGVILVTTKKGNKGKATVKFSAALAQEKAITKMNLLSSTADFMEAHNIASINHTPGGSLRFQQSTIDEWRAADANPDGMYTDPYNKNTIPNWLAYPNTDWAQEMFQPALYHKYDLTVSGGNDNARYHLSGSYQNNPGSLENTGMQRYNMRANIEIKVNDYITFGTQTSAIKEFKEPGSTSMTYLSQAYPGITPKYKGLFGTSEDSNMAVANNVLHSVALAGGEIELSRINTSWFANVDIWKGLSFEAKFNYSEYQRQDATYSQDIPRYRFRQGTNEPATSPALLDQATSSRYSYYSSNYTADLFLRYIAKFGDHDINAFVAYEQYYAKTSGFRLSVKGLLDWNVTDLNSGAEMLDWGTTDNKNDATKRELGMLSYFGRVNYAFKGKYLVEATLRADGSSRFAPNNRWGTFPSASVGWRVSEEDFFNPVRDVVNYLKVRASYGSLGNQVSGYYDWQSIYSKRNNVFNESIQNGVVQSQLPNFLLSWEKTTTTDIAIEANFLNNRLSTEFDYFRRFTSDMLVTPPQYLSVGNVTSPKANAAEMQNSGIDIGINWNDKIGDFRYFVGFNAAYNTNEVTKYKGKLIYEADPNTPDIWGNPTKRYTNLGDVMATESDNRVVEGRMIGEHFLRKPYKGDGSYMGTDGKPNPNGGPKDGMIRTKADLDWVRAMIAEGYSFNNKTVNTSASNIWYGDMIFADANGDGRYGNDDDREFTGKSAFPKWNFGFNFSAEWKGFDMSMTWHSRVGSYHYILQRAANSNILSTLGDGLPYDAMTNYYMYDAVKASTDPNYDPAQDPKANILAKNPRLLAATSTMVDNTFYLYNTSYVKLKTLQIGYTLPKKFLAPAKISNLRIYMAGENLLAFYSKDFPVIDPELGGGFNTYPLARMISGGVSVTF